MESKPNQDRIDLHKHVRETVPVGFMDFLGFTSDEETIETAREGNIAGAVVVGMPNQDVLRLSENYTKP